MGVREGDQEALDAVLRSIYERVPDVVKVSFQTTDQDYVGFELVDLELSSGSGLSSVAPVRLARTAEHVWPLISGIGWAGVMGEDEYGNAALMLGCQGQARPSSIA